MNPILWPVTMCRGGSGVTNFSYLAISAEASAGWVSAVAGGLMVDYNNSLHASRAQRIYAAMKRT